MTWQERAACAAPWVDPVWFTDDVEQAIVVCQGCPVRAECWAYAVRAREQGAVWGGRWRGSRLPAPVSPVPGPYPCEGHAGSRYKYASGLCRSAGCHAAKVAYEREAQRKRRRVTENSSEAVSTIALCSVCSE